MRRTSTKKGIERRKKKRGRVSSAPAENKALTPTHACQFCGKELQKDERALFVEEEMGRIFCTEECISHFFAPEIERLEKEYHRRSSPNDLSSEEKEKFGHLRWITLQEADEIWREKTLTGDYRYTLISEFLPTSKSVWSVCICLFLRGEPSFLFISFVTRNPAMVDHYRKGERVERSALQVGESPSGLGADNEQASGAGSSPGNILTSGAESPSPNGLSDRLASQWTADETYLAQMNQGRSTDDIPLEEFDLYRGCLEQTLESPHEVWTLELGQKDSIRLFHFIRHYPEEGPEGIWYVVVAKETEQEDQIEIVDAFPTRDSELITRYRMGERELGLGLSDPSASASRVVH